MERCKLEDFRGLSGYAFRLTSRVSAVYRAIFRSTHPVAHSFGLEAAAAEGLAAPPLGPPIGRLALRQKRSRRVGWRELSVVPRKNCVVRSSVICGVWV